MEKDLTVLTIDEIDLDGETYGVPRNTELSKVFPGAQIFNHRGGQRHWEVFPQAFVGKDLVFAYEGQRYNVKWTDSATNQYKQALEQAPGPGVRHVPLRNTAPRSPMKLLSSPLARPAQRSPVWDLDDLDRYGIPTESTTLVPRYLIPFRDWLCHQSTSLPAVLEEHLDEMDPEMQNYFHSGREARSVTLRSVGDEYQVGNTEISFVLNAEWQQHSIRMLTTTYRKLKMLAADLSDGMKPTESTWRSYIHSNAEDIIFLAGHDSKIECNSKVATVPASGPTLLPDVALGVGRSFRPGAGDASATRRLQVVYLDIEEKRNEQNEDECKLLVIMSLRLQHLASVIGDDHPHTASNRIPVPVALGVVRSASKWSLLMMWPVDSSQHRFDWTYLVDESDLQVPKSFVFYTCFTAKMAQYSRLFGEALDELVQLSESPEHKLGGRADDGDRDRERDVDGGGGGGGGGQGSGESSRRGDGSSRRAGGGDGAQNKANNLHGGRRTRCEAADATRLTYRSDGQRDPHTGRSMLHETSSSMVELVQQVGGEDPIVRKCYCDPNVGVKLYQREVRAYQILGVNGTPHTLQLRHCSESQLTLELEYQPNVGRYYPETMDELRQYARQVLKALQYIHAMQLVHADLKPDNILVCPAASKGNFKVKVIDFGFARSVWEEGGYEFRGTPGYVAPEVSLPPRGKAPCISEASDMFSFGVILLEMLLFLDLTWCQRDTDRLTQLLDQLMATTARDERSSSARWTELCGGLFDRVQELFPDGEFAPRLELLCPEALDLVWQLTRKDPNLRLSARAALCHPLLG